LETIQNVLKIVSIWKFSTKIK